MGRHLRGSPLPVHDLFGSEDELLYADRFAPLINRERPDVPVILVPGVDHMGMVTDPRALAAIATAIQITEITRRAGGVGAQ